MLKYNLYRNNASDYSWGDISGIYDSTSIASSVKLNMYTYSSNNMYGLFKTSANSYKYTFIQKVYCTEIRNGTIRQDNALYNANDFIENFVGIYGQSEIYYFYWPNKYK